MKQGSSQMAPTRAKQLSFIFLFSAFPPINIYWLHWATLHHFAMIYLIFRYYFCICRTAYPIFCQIFCQELRFWTAFCFIDFSIYSCPCDWVCLCRCSLYPFKLGRGCQSSLYFQTLDGVLTEHFVKISLHMLCVCVCVDWQALIAPYFSCKNPWLMTSLMPLLPLSAWLEMGFNAIVFIWISMWSICSIQSVQPFLCLSRHVM